MDEYLGYLKSLPIPKCQSVADELMYAACRDKIVNEMIHAFGAASNSSRFLKEDQIFPVDSHTLAHEVIERTFDTHRNFLRARLHRAEMETAHWKRVALSCDPNAAERYHDLCQEANLVRSVATQSSSTEPLNGGAQPVDYTSASAASGICCRVCRLGAEWWEAFSRDSLRALQEKDDYAISILLWCFACSNGVPLCLPSVSLGTHSNEKAERNSKPNSRKNLATTMPTRSARRRKPVMVPEGVTKQSACTFPLPKHRGRELDPVSHSTTLSKGDVGCATCGQLRCHAASNHDGVYGVSPSASTPIIPALRLHAERKHPTTSSSHLYLVQSLPLHPRQDRNMN